MMKIHKRMSVVFLVIIMVVVCHAPAEAQLMGLLSLERLSLLDAGGTGGRPMGMGSAYTAVSDDAFAILYNPAGLTQIKDREISFGIHHRQVKIDAIYDVYRAANDNSYTSIGHLAYAVPLDSYYDSAVLGIGVFRVSSSDLEYIRNASRMDLEGTIMNSFKQSGSIYQYRLGVGVELTPKIAFGASLVLWNSSVDFNETVDYTHGSSDSSYTLSDNGSAELTGVSIEVGVMLWLSDYIKAGLTMSTPAKLYYDGDGENSYTGTFPDGYGWTTDNEYYYIEDEFTIPMKFTGGISFSAGDLLLAADVTWCDFSQVEYNNLNLSSELDPMRDVIESSFSYSLGAEFTVPGSTMSIRGGYSWIPLAMQGMDEITYVIDTPAEWGIVTEYDFVTIEDDRQFFTLGIGGIVDDVLALDLGIRYGSFKRKTDFLTDKRDFTEIMLSGAYRF
ncbi:MAG: outer membrane protein transport protein [Bacteroidales bacterium]|nr:outer membrane protein transport protein [Candidatus Latescibacterota bacterium]